MKSALGWTSALAAMSAGLAAHADIPGVREIGRTVELGSSGMEIQWSGSGFETTVEGSQLTAVIDDSGDNFLSIEVNGAPFILDLDAGRFAYTLFKGEPGRHTIRVTRRTSALAPATRISNIRSDGALTAPEAPARNMLVIGDSISTGFGVEGEGPNCSFTYMTQNQNRTYAALAARHFGADLHNISIDGRGLVRNWDNASVPTMGELYKRTLPNRLAVWPAATYTPDVIMVHLGTNDFVGHRPGDAFSTAYDAMLGDLRTTYPNALVFAMIGPSLSGEDRALAVNAIKGVVEKRVAAGDAKLRFMDMQVSSGPRAWGCDWHPGLDTQAENAQALQKAISADLGW